MCVTSGLNSLFAKIKTSKFLRCILIGFGALPFAVIAAFRVNVGTDYTNYVKMFSEFSSLSLSEFLKLDGRVEIGFFIIVKFLQLFSASEKLIFFVIEFITIYTVFFTLYKYGKNINVWACGAIYFVLYFHLTLNIVRQALAMSFVFLAIYYLINKRYCKYIIWNGVAVLFHKTAIICFVFLLVMLLLRRDYRRQTVKIQLSPIRLLFYIAIVLSPVIIRMIIPVLLRMEFFSKYVYYDVNVGNKIGLGMIFKYALFAAPILFVTLRKGRVNILQLKLFDLYTLFLPISSIGYFISFANRLYLYPEMIVMVLVSSFVSSLNSKRTKVGLSVYYVVLMIVIYVYDYLILNLNETYPLFLGFI